MAAIYQWFSGNITGLCGTIYKATIGSVLPQHMIMMQDDGPKTLLSASSNEANSTVIADSKSVCFTAFFVLENTPTIENAALIDVRDSVLNRRTFGFYMDTSGFMRIVGLNTAGATILDVTITNNGASFADTTMYQFGVVINLDDVTKREIWLDNDDITDNASYVTWTTYTDDFIQLESFAAPDQVQWGFGINLMTAHSFSYGPNAGTGYGGGATAYDSFGYITFDNSCTLVPAAIWNDDGWVMDPQKWEGWYATQPKVFFGPSLWKNSGSVVGEFYEMNLDNFPSNLYVYAVGGALGEHYQQSTNCMVNYGIGGTV